MNNRGEAIGIVSWRKADAENLGFAVPCSAVPRLNAALPPTAWVETAPRAYPPGKQAGPAPLVRASVEAGDTGASNAGAHLPPPERQVARRKSIKKHDEDIREGRRQVCIRSTGQAYKRGRR